MSLKRDAENEREGCVLLKERDDIMTYSIFIFFIIPARQMRFSSAPWAEETEDLDL